MARTLPFILLLSLCCSTVAQVGGGGSGSEIDTNPQNPANWNHLVPVLSGTDEALTYEIGPSGVAETVHFSREWNSGWKKNNISMGGASPSIPIGDSTGGNHAITMDSEGSILYCMQWVGVGQAPASVRVKVVSPVYCVTAYQRGSLATWAANGIGTPTMMDPGQLQINLMNPPPVGIRQELFAVPGGFIREIPVFNGLAAFSIEKEAHATTQTGWIAGTYVDGVLADAKGLSVSVDGRGVSLGITSTDYHVKKVELPNQYTYVKFPQAKSETKGMDPRNGVRRFRSVEAVFALPQYSSTATNFAEWDYALDYFRVNIYNDNWTISPALVDQWAREQFSWTGSVANAAPGGNYEYLLTESKGQTSLAGSLPSSSSTPWTPNSLAAEYLRPVVRQHYDTWPKEPKDYILRDERQMNAYEIATFRYHWPSDGVEAKAVRKLVMHPKAEDLGHDDVFYDFKESEPFSAFEYAETQATLPGGAYIPAGDDTLDIIYDNRSMLRFAKMLGRVALAIGAVAFPEGAALAFIIEAADVGVDVADPQYPDTEYSIDRMNKRAYDEDVTEPSGYESLVNPNPGPGQISHRGDSPWYATYRHMFKVYPKIVDFWGKNGFVLRAFDLYEVESSEDVSPRRYYFDVSYWIP